jgi:hypothetical protein
MAEENPSSDGVPEWLIKLESRKKVRRIKAQELFS